MKHFKETLQKDILVISFDMKDKAVNLLNDQTLKELKKIMGAADLNPQVNGIIIESAKENFCLGADITFIKKLIAEHKTPSDLVEKIWDIQLFFSSFNKPTACLIHGQCLGGGLELALACDYRVGVQNTKLRLGLPEVRIGIMPGLGGTQRLPRLIGLEPALQMLLKGTTIKEDKALSQGVIDDIAPTLKSAKTIAESLIKNGKKKLKEIDIYTSSNTMVLSAASALTKKQAQGCYKNIEYLLQALHDGHLVSLAHGLRTETEFFVKTLMEPSVEHMLDTIYTQRQALRKKAKEASQKHVIQTLGVIGGGFMGAAIAAHALASNLPVVLIEKDADSLVTAKDNVDALLQKYPTAKFPKITITKNLASLKKCELVIEAVYEDIALKQRVLSHAENHLSPNAILASNTSTLPITELALALARPEQFVGIHFFSPVAKMALIEIIEGKKTKTPAIQHAKSLTSLMNKTPILVKDTRGFYTSSVCMGYIYEAITLLTEGVNPIQIENAGKQIGMPASPLALIDEIGIDIAWHILQESHKDTSMLKPNPQVITLINRMYEEKRLGRKTQKGFYIYHKDKYLWPELFDLFPSKEYAFTDIKKRLLNAQVSIAHGIYNKGLISKEEANVGAVLGLGFCPWSGGPLNIESTDS